MGLHRMPYGPRGQNPNDLAAGSLELIGQSAIVPRLGEFELPDVDINAQNLQTREDDPELEDAVEAASNANIIVMNPPFTSRSKMGEKFPKQIQAELRARTDRLERRLVECDRQLKGFVDKNSIGPLFVALADRCLNNESGILALINPTSALVATSGKRERVVLAKRYHVHSILTCHVPGQSNLSQNTNINESLVICCRHDGPRPSTRIIQLDRMPANEDEAADFHSNLRACDTGLIKNGWGEVFEWPADRIETGDWTGAIWRSGQLAEAAADVAKNGQLKRIGNLGLKVSETGRVLRGKFQQADTGGEGAFPIVKSKGTDGQKYIRSFPDQFCIPKMEHRKELAASDSHPILKKSGRLLITAGQRNNTGRLTAVADDEKFVGNGWYPVAGLSSAQAKALAVFMNSTIGRLQIMRSPGKTIQFPTYSARELRNIGIPDLFSNRDSRAELVLERCWHETCEMPVPQYRDGDCDVRRLW
ncbi:MAG: hypothetical protein OXB95_14295, partial [Rhodobacteraceae bacterium]|nr:hypothetical protein [Paracoccaceae bacterium]